MRSLVWKGEFLRSAEVASPKILPRHVLVVLETFPRVIVGVISNAFPPKERDTLLVKSQGTESEELVRPWVVRKTRYLLVQLPAPKVEVASADPGIFAYSWATSD